VFQLDERNPLFVVGDFAPSQFENEYFLSGRARHAHSLCCWACHPIDKDDQKSNGGIEKGLLRAFILILHLVCHGFPKKRKAFRVRGDGWNFQGWPDSVFRPLHRSCRHPWMRQSPELHSALHWTVFGV
jgi:hypothetical protein